MEAKALLLCEVDGMSQDLVNTEAEAVIEVLKRNNCEYKAANTDAERDQLWAARRNALPALASLNNTCIVEDATVPRSRITEMLVACEQIAAKYQVTIGTFGHAGDGNLHPTILFDKYDLAKTAQVHLAVDEIFATALALGGTLSGEHGIGMAKMKYLKDELGQGGLDLMKTIKEALDPDCCGSGGSFVLTHYDTSSALGRNKAQDINQTGAGTVSVGCPACMMQLLDNLGRFGNHQEVAHYISLLAESYRKEKGE